MNAVFRFSTRYLDRHEDSSLVHLFKYCTRHKLSPNCLLKVNKSNNNSSLSDTLNWCDFKTRRFWAAGTISSIRLPSGSRGLQGRITQENFLSRTRLDRRDPALCVTGCHLAWVSKLLMGRGAVWGEARKIDFFFLAPSPYSYNPRRRPPRYIWKSRWPPLTVRRATSPRSHEKTGDCEQSSHVLYQTGLTITIFRTWKCFCCGHYVSCSQHADQYVQRHHISQKKRKALMTFTFQCCILNITTATTDNPLSPHLQRGKYLIVRF